MIRFCEQILELANELSEDELEDDWVSTLALIRLFETLGEASTKVSDALKRSHPEIAWESTKRMRNRLIHGYDSIEYEIIWKTIGEDIPALLHQLDVLYTELKRPPL